MMFLLNLFQMWPWSPKPLILQIIIHFATSRANCSDSFYPDEILGRGCVKQANRGLGFTLQQDITGVVGYFRECEPGGSFFVA